MKNETGMTPEPLAAGPAAAVWVPQSRERLRSKADVQVEGLEGPERKP